MLIHKFFPDKGAYCIAWHAEVTEEDPSEIIFGNDVDLEGFNQTRKRMCKLRFRTFFSAKTYDLTTRT